MNFKFNILLALLFYSIPFNLFAQQKLVNPPGVVKLSDSLIIDLWPIQNIHYIEFLWNLQHPESIQQKYEKSESNKSTRSNLYTVYNSLYGKLTKEQIGQYFPPDTLTYSWVTQTGNPDTSKSDKKYDAADANYYYMIAPAYHDYPMINITYTQAKDYCNWRSFVVNFLMYKQNKKNFREVKYRLPSSTELISAYQKTTHKDELKNKDSLDINEPPFPMIVSPVTGDEIFNSGNFFVSPILELTADKKVVGYNESGKGIITGTYESPKQNLGFRCVCEYVK